MNNCKGVIKKEPVDLSLVFSERENNLNGNSRVLDKKDQKIDFQLQFPMNQSISEIQSEVQTRLKYFEKIVKNNVNKNEPTDLRMLFLERERNWNKDKNSETSVSIDMSKRSESIFQDPKVARNGRKWIFVFTHF